MKRNAGIILILAVVIIVGAVVAVSSNRQSGQNTDTSGPATENDANNTLPTGPDTESSQAPEGSQVTIQGFAFKPETITVKKGTTVTWTNQDSAKHNVVSESDSPSKGLNGPLLSQGQSYSYTFTEVGTYKYFCEPHPYMKATVEVTQ